MATAESASKICVVCGQSVAGKPRVKDAAGRYMCAGTCQEKAAAAAKAAPPAVPRAVAPPPKAATPPPMAKSSGDGSFLNDLIASSPMLSAAACEQCGSPMPGGAVLCTRCGFNTQTGKAIKTAVIREKEKKEPNAPKQPRRSGEFGPSFEVLTLIFCAVTLLPAMLSFINPMLLLAAFLVLPIFGLVGYVWTIVSAFRMGERNWGIWGLLVLVPIVNLVAVFAFLYYALLANEDKWSRSIYVAYFVGLLATLGVLFGVIGINEFSSVMNR